MAMAEKGTGSGGLSPITRELVGGAVGGFVQDVIMHPADTVRARLQVVRTELRSSLAAYGHVVRNTFARQGPLGFYNGFSCVFLFSMPANALYFTSYSVAKREFTRLRDTHAASVPDSIVFLLAGFAAQICASVVFTPSDVAKQRLQVLGAATTTASGGKVPMNGVSMVRQIVAQEGWLGLYRGTIAGDLVSFHLI